MIRRITATRFSGTTSSNSISFNSGPATRSSSLNTTSPCRWPRTSITCPRGIAPLRELGAIPRGHVIDVLGHLHGEVVLSDELRVAGPELKEMLLELVVPEKRV